MHIWTCFLVLVVACLSRCRRLLLCDMTCDAIVMSQYCFRNTHYGAYTVTTRIAVIAYDAKSVAILLVWHAVVEPACLRFSKPCHDGRVLNNRGFAVCGSLKSMHQSLLETETETHRDYYIWYK